MNHIVAGESNYDNSSIGDTQITCKTTGKKETAMGLVQINDCYWNFTEAQKLDPDFSLNFLAYWISKGHCGWWSTCKVNDYLAFK